MPEPYVPLARRRLVVTIVFSVIAAISVVALVADVTALNLIERLVAGESVSDAELTADDRRQVLIGAVQLVGLLVGAVVFIDWLYRAYRNLDTVAPHERRYSHGWAIGGWFVPIMNFWRPKQIVNDVWRAGLERRPGGLLWFWWAAFILSRWMSFGSNSTANDSDASLDELQTAAVGYIAADVCSILGAVLVIALVRRAGDGLDRRHAALPPQPESPPAPDLVAPERPAGLPA